MCEISQKFTSEFQVLPWQSLIEAYSQERYKIQYTVSQKGEA